jgi:hypothetical protein
MVLHVAAAAAATAHCTRCCHLQLWTARLHGSGAALSVASLVDLLGSWRRCERTDAWQQRQQQNGNTSSSPRSLGEGLADVIGNTPLIRLKSLSEQTGCEVRDCWLPALALMRSPPTAHRLALPPPAASCLPLPLLPTAPPPVAAAADLGQGRIPKPRRKCEGQGSAGNHSGGVG